jgi:hypothetical protein
MRNAVDCVSWIVTNCRQSEHCEHARQPEIGEQPENRDLNSTAGVSILGNTMSVKALSHRVLVFQETTQSRIAVGVLDAASGSMKKPRRMKSKTMKLPGASQRKQVPRQTVGYVVAEDVMDVTPPNYDYDNIAVEADELFINAGGWNTRSSLAPASKHVAGKPRARGIPSFAVIQKALDTVR